MGGLMMKRLFGLLFVVVCCLGGDVVCQDVGGDGLWDPPAVYLEWQRDPTTTMTVHWLSEGDRAGSVVEYRLAADEGGEWMRGEGGSTAMAGNELLIHTVELTGLEPSGVYVFRCGSDGKVFRFRTMPAELDRPIRFAVGGDIYSNDEQYRHMNGMVGARDPDFCLIGGDIAYDNGLIENAWKWERFLAGWEEALVTPDGRLVPLVVAIGNHEVIGGYGASYGDALWFYDLFAFPGKPAYGVLDFGDYLSVVVLDTGHNQEIGGEQTAWLRRTLEARVDVKHVAALYHVPAYPARRRLGGELNTEVREHWVPLFEEFGLDFAFEHHEHAYKRTYPIRGGEVDEMGVVYLGDGGWGMPHSREPASPGNWWNDGRWYLAKSAQAVHFNFATLDGDVRRFEAVGQAGEAFDRYEMVDGMASVIVRTPSAGLGWAGYAAIAVPAALLGVLAVWWSAWRGRVRERKRGVSAGVG